MSTYAKAGPDILEVLDNAITSYHADLDRAEVTVGVLVAWPGDDGGPAVKLHGYPCAAIVKLTSYRDRVLGVADAVITIDGEGWKALAEDERLALLDHKLEHLEVVRDDEGQARLDDANWPKLKVRLHDVEYGAFASVARRHGAAAPEVRHARQIAEAYGQLLFAWGEPVGV